MLRGRMTSSGLRWTFFFGAVFALALPKRVECGFPGAASCRSPNQFGMMCTAYEVEPFGLYLIELIAKRDVGFAYSTDKDCR